jgi:hypothetical protein
MSPTSYQLLHPAVYLQNISSSTHPVATRDCGCKYNGFGTNLKIIALFHGNSADEEENQEYYHEMDDRP